MNKKSIIHYLPNMFLLLISLLALPMANASLSNAFDQMADTTSKLLGSNKVYAGGRTINHNGRMTQTFGSASVRFQMTTPAKIIAFKPASLSAGCGGIDMFMGSISVVSSEELINMARSVAQGALVYGFNLAMTSICADCAAIMTDISNRMEELNQFAKTSCQDTVNALNRWGQDDPEKEVKENGIRSSLNSATGGWLSKSYSPQGSWLDSLTDTSTNGKLEAGEEGTNAASLGNITWNALRNVDMTGWAFEQGWNEQNAKLLLLSLLGTQIVNEGSVGGSSPDLVFTTVPPTITLDELMYTDAGGAATIKLLNCKPDEDSFGNSLGTYKKCLEFSNPGGSSGELTDYKGLYHQAKDMMIGSVQTDGTRSGGIRDAIKIKLDLRPDEYDFAVAATLPVTEWLFPISNPELEMRNVNYMAKYIAFDITYSILRELNLIVSHTYDSLESNKQMSSAVKTNFKNKILKFKQEMLEFRKENTEEFQRLQSMSTLHSQLRTNGF